MGLVEKDPSGRRLRPDGKPIRVAIETMSINNRVLELVANYWTAVGVKTEIKEEARQLYYERRKALIHDAATAGGEVQNPLLEPRLFVPYNVGSSHAIGFTHWLLTNGKRGETPTGDMRRCIELFWQIEETPDEAEQVRLFGEIIELNRKNLWVIGTIGSMPSIMLVHNTFRNVPEVAMASWSVRTPANTAVECYAIEPYR